eukprot:scaffold125675_cov63-Phaeocystis_antarctica.AAC.3
MPVPLDLDELPLEIAYELIVLGAELFAPPPLPSHHQRMARHPHEHGEAHQPNVRLGLEALRAEHTVVKHRVERVESVEVVLLQAHLLVELREGGHHRRGRSCAERQLFDVSPRAVALGRPPAGDVAAVLRRRNLRLPREVVAIRRGLVRVHQAERVPDLVHGRGLKVYRWRPEQEQAQRGGGYRYLGDVVEQPHPLHRHGLAQLAALLLVCLRLEELLLRAQPGLAVHLVQVVVAADHVLRRGWGHRPVGAVDAGRCGAAVRVVEVVGVHVARGGRGSGVRQGGSPRLDGDPDLREAAALARHRATRRVSTLGALACDIGEGELRVVD